MDWRNHISVNPAVCHGKACIKGTRVLVTVVLDNLASGQTHQEIAAGYHITLDDVRAAVGYAAEIAKERVVDLPASAG